jgi:hypothetical protein
MVLVIELMPPNHKRNQKGFKMVETLHSVLVDVKARDAKTLKELLLKNFIVAAYWYN